MKSLVYKIFTPILLVVSAAVSGYYINKKVEIDRENWTRTVRDFYNCDLTVVLWKFGKGDLQNVHGLTTWLQLGYETDLYSKLIVDANNQNSSNNREPKTIWIDPDKINSISAEKSAKSQISFFDYCNNLVENGKFEVGIGLAYFYLFGNFSNSEYLIEDLARKGVVDAYILLGHSYRNGILNSIKDERKALELYLKAANKGSVKGMLNVAEMIYDIDKQKSKIFLISAATDGSLAALYQLQDIYGKYRYKDDYLTSIDKKDAKVLYFWNLIFGSIYHFHLKEGTLALDFSKTSPYLKEVGEGPPFDGVPTSPISDSSVVKYFDLSQSEVNKKFLEGILDVKDRVQVQEKAREWVIDFEKRYRAKSGKKSQIQ